MVTGEPESLKRIPSIVPVMFGNAQSRTSPQTLDSQPLAISLHQALYEMLALIVEMGAPGLQEATPQKRI